VPNLHGIEALAVTALTFGLGALLGVWPFMVQGLTPGQALFESMSAITSTGLTLARGLDAAPFSVLFLRHWFQWYGGFAIIVLAVGLVVGHGNIARRLGAIDMDDASRLQSARGRARRILAVYVAATAAAWLVLGLLLRDPGAGLLYALSAVATGGFAPSDANLQPAGAAVAAVVLALCVASAVSYDQWLRTFERGARTLVADPETRLLLGLVLVLAVLVVVAEGLAGHGWRPWQALAQAASAQSTAGFSTTPTAELSAASQLVLAAAMLGGGDVGSTAGGFKLVRLLLLAAVLRTVWLRLAAGPRAVIPLERAGRRVQPEELEAATALGVVMLLALLAGWLVLTAHGAAPLAAFFDTASALATAGLTAGVVGPDLAAVPTAVLTALMWLGRVELFAVLILVFPSTWRPRRS
jgi:trk system potassium uptake protein TrkH